ncbi:MAG: tRNA (adenosine(37)-N6)-threonylcarbamoyltransferase complex transferase subunit TsaD [Rhodospirillaceae bacterium]|nr:tRNA (adenosine(37)-N6)-threonylcarbamoyltransferase complex transferase subunit TsaD [Rhodospirillaceae bacterium]
MTIALGIETSCDETAVALVGSDRRILAQSILSQIAEHRPYGGVVPEIAARNHLIHLRPLLEKTLQQAQLSLDQIDVIAATAGPGLIGGLIVGLTMAKSIALAKNKPLIAVNHLEGHALTARLTDAVEFPYILLLVSGGHCQLLLVKAVGDYQCLGTTLDDALGEAFDKVAKMLGLGFPGGPAVEAAAKQSALRAQQGDKIQLFPLPRPMLGRPDPNFSFSGLKTAVYQQASSLGPVGSQLPLAAVQDLAASFQVAAIDCIIDRVDCALKRIKQQKITLKGLVAAGGVASNQFLRQKLQALCGEYHLPCIIPPPALCTDNAAMIAWAGLEWFKKGRQDGLDTLPRPRWPLDPNFTVSYS